MTTAEPAATTPSLEEEAAVRYDRQVRLWGTETQKRLQATTLVLHGTAAAGTEICKNLVLAGVGTLVVVPDATASAGDASFLRQSAPDIVSALRGLNPLVQVSEGPAPSSTVAEGGRRVDLLANPTLATLEKHVAAIENPDADNHLVVAVLSLAHTAMAVLLRRPVELKKMFHAPPGALGNACLPRHPGVYKHTLAWKLHGSSTTANGFGQALRHAMQQFEVSAAHGTPLVDSADVSAAVEWAVADTRGALPCNVLLDSVVGGVVAEHIISRGAKPTAGKDATQGTEFDWAVVDTAGSVSTVVGKM